MAKTKRYLKLGRFTVTSRTLGTGKRTYQLARLEKTALKRPGLIFALAITAASAGLFWSFQDLIYEHEVPFFFVPQIVATLITSRIAILVVQSKALGSEVAAIGLYGRLARVRAAIDEALEDLAERESKSHMAADDDD
tara:strand:- start:1505 stop:1918 length:414 start_codon:yes stop_codon:yes gene_type:complete